MAGFPCQPFSVAGYQQGLSDTRGKIVNNVLHHISHQLPKMFVLENVKGFSTLDNGKYVKQIVQFLKQIQKIMVMSTMMMIMKMHENLMNLSRSPPLKSILPWGPHLIAFKFQLSGACLATH